MVGTVKSQTGKTALLLGVGYTARALIRPLKRAGFDIVGTCRTEEKARALSGELGITMQTFEGHVDASLQKAMVDADLVLSSIPPTDAGDPVLNALGEGPAFPYASWVGYLSATSVYGDRGGQWVFEDELLYPTTTRGKNRVEAELSWLETGAPVHVFRLAGIYGPDIHGMSRNPFARIREGQARAVIKPRHVVNRIHVEDIARALMASIENPNPTLVYNIADGHPAPPQDVIKYAADLLGLPHPRDISADDPSLSDMAKSFYAESKRVSNARAKTELKWEPKYPNYEMGLRAILKN